MLDTHKLLKAEHESNQDKGLAVKLVYGSYNIFKKHPAFSLFHKHKPLVIAQSKQFN